MPLFEVGDTIRFTYSGHDTKDRFKEALILHTNWNGKVHALDLKRMTVAEREVIKVVMDPRMLSLIHI